MIAFDSQWFKTKWQEAKSRAGRRYEPGLNINLPIGEYFESLTQDAKFFAKFSEHLKELEKSRTRLRLKETPVSADQAAEFERYLDEVLAQLREITDARNLPQPLPLDRIAQLSGDAAKLAAEILAELPESRRPSTYEPPSASDRAREATSRIEYELENLLGFCSGPIAALTNDPSFLLLGSAGTGKTHLLCEVTRKQIENEMPALLFLGQTFRAPFDNALEALTRSVHPTIPSEEFLTALDDYGRARGTRCLISVDAINEGHRQSWLNGLPVLVTTIRRYPGLALVIGCRTPFEKLLVPASDELRLHIAHHFGFHAGRLDAFLGRQTLVERDLFWSEYLRKSRERGTPSRILVWAEHLAPGAPSLDFAAAYIKVLKWFLTSTQRGFRDRATRALFRLGRAQPNALFAETLQSLAINDPYVPQRMLAASYGTTMALWQDRGITDFQARILPRFARKLLANMFARNAKHATTHILTRDYAQRIIELTVLVRPRSLSIRDRRLASPPFRFGGIRQWGEEADQDEDQYREGDAPLGMDFANYTLGRLVRNRHPYDDHAGDYPQVKKQIFWRIYDLGYSLALFSSTDREIARQSWYGRQRGQESDSTDRYGKKYAWIAFYELAGYRTDAGLMEREDRISDADIDPSFPEKPESARLFERSWIEHEGSVRQWLLSGYQPNVQNRLILHSVGNLVGPWAMLNGHVNNETADKTIFAFFDGLFVRTKDTNDVIQALSLVEYPGNHHIPRPESEHYTYAGEVPWADTWRAQQYPQTIVLGGGQVPVFPTVRHYSWESYHSIENQTGSLSFPAKEMGEDLKLYVKIPSISMAQRGSYKPATVTVDWGDKPYRDYESFLFIRQDLLDGYLQRKDLSLVLAVWGERRANYRDHRDARQLEGKFEITNALHK